MLDSWIARRAVGAGIYRNAQSWADLIMPAQRRYPLGAALWAGLIAGTIDIGAAALINRVNPEMILHNIAGGVLARAALSGGWRTAVLGLVLQWVMSILIAGLYLLAAGAFTVLRRRWVAGGLAYGVVIFFVMNYVVVPLSAWHVTPHFRASRLIGNVLAMLIFGLIVAYFARARHR
jgi:uncharacterized membrane protein YagU involved in acid resistance